MLRSTVSRIRLCICALGCVVLGASLSNWAQALHGAGQQYTWTSLGASAAPPLETAEVWQVSAACVQPYFVRALMRSEAHLKSYYALAPEAVRARLNRPIGAPTSAAPRAWYHLVNDDSGRRDAPDKEYTAALHVEYAEWYANVYKLEIEASRWQQRLIDVADQRLILSESARKSFGANSRQNSGPDSKLMRPTGRFEDHVMTMLGLGGFPSGEEQALKSDCVKIDMVEKILRDPDYFAQLWRWPVDQAAAVAFGLELVLVGIFLVPITLWIGTGDRQIARRHLRDAADRLTARVRSFSPEKFALDVLEYVRAVSVRTRAFLMDCGSAATRQVLLLLRMAASPNFTATPMRWGDEETSGAATSPPPRPSPEDRQPW